MEKTGIEKIRKKNGLTILELSKLLNINTTVIKSWEEGAGSISLSILYDLINKLNTTAEIILFSVETPPLNIDSLSEKQKNYIFLIYDLIKDNYSGNIKVEFQLNNNTIITKSSTSISDKIKYLRENILNMSQSKFAKMINVTRGSVSNWEHGYSKPTISHITMICSLCHITPDYLIMKDHPLEISARDLSDDQYYLLQEFIEFFKKENKISL